MGTRSSLVCTHPNTNVSLSLSNFHSLRVPRIVLGGELGGAGLVLRRVLRVVRGMVDGKDNDDVALHPTVNKNLNSD